MLDHEGYEGDQSAKHRRNLPLLKSACAPTPPPCYSWCHLAGIYAATGKLRLAERAWTRALEVVRAKPYRQPEDCLPYVGLIERGLRRGRAVEDLLEEALVKFPRNLYLQYLYGKALMRAGRFAEAIPVFERLRRSGEAGDYDHSFAYDVRLLDVIPYESLAACHFKLGHYAESRRYYELAAACDPGKLEYRVKQALCARLEPRSGLARTLTTHVAVPAAPASDTCAITSRCESTDGAAFRRRAFMSTTPYSHEETDAIRHMCGGGAPHPRSLKKSRSLVSMNLRPPGIPSGRPRAKEHCSLMRRAPFG